MPVRKPEGPGETTARERFADQFAAAFYAGLAAAVDRAVHRAGELFQNLPLRPKITLNQNGSPSFESLVHRAAPT